MRGTFAARKHRSPVTLHDRALVGAAFPLAYKGILRLKSCQRVAGFQEGRFSS